MKRKSVKQHLDLFEQDKEPVRVPPGLRKEMLHLVEMLLVPSAFQFTRNETIVRIHGADSSHWGEKHLFQARATSHSRSLIGETLNIHGLENEDAAREFGRRVALALLLAGARQDVGIDAGENRATSGPAPCSITRTHVLLRSTTTVQAASARQKPMPRS